MQIRNSQNDSSKPLHSKHQASEKDLPKSRSQGVADARATGSEKPSDAGTKRAEPRALRDSFERSKPQQDPGVDVGQRLREARSKAHEKRLDGARTKDTQDRLEERISNAREKNTMEQRQERISNARTKNTAEAQAGRIAEARKDHTEASSSVDRKRINHGNLSRESVQLSARGENLGAEMIEDARGLRESSAERAERVQNLRMEYENGSLNTADRIRQAAERMLADD